MSISSFYSAESRINSSPDKTPKRQHNPFDHLYDSTGSTPVKRQSVNDDIRHSQIYQDIENSISNFKSPSPFKSKSASPLKNTSSSQEHDRAAPNIINEPHPIVTLVDTSALRRSPSIVSTSASIRSRNRIKNRMRMAKKNDLVGYSSDHHEIPISANKKTTFDESNFSKDESTKKSKPFFQFPVRRTTSLKRKPYGYNAVGQSMPHFRKKSDMDEFYNYCISNSNTVLAELLPKAMKFFEVNGLYAPHRPSMIGNYRTLESEGLTRVSLAPPIVPPPKLKAKVAPIQPVPIGSKIKPKSKSTSKSLSKVKSERKTKLKSILPSKKKSVKRKRVQISAPIKESFTHNGYNPYVTTTAEAAVAAAAAATGSPIKIRQQRDYPIDLDIVSHTDPDSIPMTLDPTSKMPGLDRTSTQLSPGTIAAVIAAAGLKSLHSSPSPPPTQPPSLSPSVPDNPYVNFRNALYNSKTKKPIPYKSLFPDAAASTNPQLGRKEISQMNRTLFLEVLLRRTISAKIAYRLSNNDEKRVSSSDLDSSDTSSSNEKGGARRAGGHHHSNDLPRLSGSDDSDSDNDSLDTNDLMEHNASLLSSELLPSPQISYSTDLFGKLGAFELPQLDQLSQKSHVSVDLFKRGASDGSPPQAGEPSEERQELQKSINLPAGIVTASELGGSRPAGNVFPTFSNLSIAPIAPSTLIVSRSTTPTNFQQPSATRQNKIPSDELFINDFNKKYFAQYGNQNTRDDLKPASNAVESGMYQLKPLNRSAETLSSSSNSDSQPALKPHSSSDSNSNSERSHSHSHTTNTTSANTTASSGHNRNRKSISSGISSPALNELDDIASKISSFMKEEFNFPSPQREHFQLQPLAFPLGDRESTPQSMSHGSPASTTKQTSPINHPPPIQFQVPIKPQFRPKMKERIEPSPSIVPIAPRVHVSQSHPPNYIYALNSNLSVEILNNPTSYTIMHSHHPTEIKSMKGSIRVAGPQSDSSKDSLKSDRDDYSVAALLTTPEREARIIQQFNKGYHSSNKSTYSTSSRYASSSE